MPDRENIPSNTEAERAVLGACLLSSEVLNNLIGTLKPDDFYSNSNVNIWRVMTEMYNAGQLVDYVTLVDELQRREVLDRFGGLTYIDGLVLDVTFTGNAGYYAGILRDYGFRRKLLNASEKIARLAVKYDLQREEILGEVEDLLFEVSGGKDTDKPAGMKELTPSVFAQVEAAYNGETQEFAGYSSGFEDINKYLTGFQPGSLNVIAARPSMGKTAFAMNIAQFGGRQEENPCVLVFSLEMPSSQLVKRMFAAQARVNVSALHKGSISPDEYMRVKEAASELNGRNIYISDRSGLTAGEFRSTCRRFKMQHPDLALIVVDYIQLMSSGSRRSENRQNEVAEISRSMKSLALELNCPVIALSQLSRQTENRTDKKPQLSDLRDSGAIEQDADTVMMMYRESYYAENENNDLCDDVAEIRIAKNRNGATGVCRLVFQREYTRFVNHAEG